MQFTCKSYYVCLHYFEQINNTLLHLKGKAIIRLVFSCHFDKHISQMKRAIQWSLISA